jgi:hypothetical protein
MSIFKVLVKMHISFLNSGSSVDEQELEVKIFHLGAHCCSIVESWWLFCKDEVVHMGPRILLRECIPTNLK